MAKDRTPDTLTTGEWVTVVALVAAGVLASAMFIGWLMERQGIIAPASNTQEATQNDD